MTPTKTKASHSDLHPNYQAVVLPPELPLKGDVKRANDAALEAGATLTAAEIESGQAAESLKAATDDDRVNALRAIEAGESHVELSGPERHQRDEKARAMLDAALPHFTRATKELRRAVARDGGYLAERRKAAEADREALVEATTELVGLVANLYESLASYEPAQELANGGASIEVYRPRQTRERLVKRVEKALDHRRDGNKQLPDIERVLADLQFYAEAV